MNNKFLIIVMLFLTTSCELFFQKSESDKAIDKMTVKFVKALSSKGFHMVGLGGGLDHTTGKHKKISVVLGTPREVYDVGTARSLLVAMLTDFINYINNCKEVEQYLADVPVTIENIHISILCENAEPGDIASMFNVEQRLCYYMEGDHPQRLVSTKIHEETFAEAKEILSREHIKEHF